MLGNSQELVAECSDALIVLYQSCPCPQSGKLKDFILQDWVAVIGGGVVDEKESEIGVVLVLDGFQELQVEIVWHQVSAWSNDTNWQLFLEVANRISLVQLVVLHLFDELGIPVLMQIHSVIEVALKRAEIAAHFLRVGNVEDRGRRHGACEGGDQAFHILRLNHFIWNMILQKLFGLLLFRKLHNLFVLQFR